MNWYILKHMKTVAFSLQPYRQILVQVNSYYQKLWYEIIVKLVMLHVLHWLMFWKVVFSHNWIYVLRVGIHPYLLSQVFSGHHFVVIAPLGLCSLLGGLFEYVSAANYFGELVEWCGYGLASWSVQGGAFALFTFCVLLPRAQEHHR